MRKILLVLLLASPLALAAPPKLIDAETYGADWPFTFAEGHLHCFAGQAVAVSDAESGRMYALNGQANAKAGALGLEPLAAVWRDDPAIKGAKVSVGQVLEDGLAHCR